MRTKSNNFYSSKQFCFVEHKRTTSNVSETLLGSLFEVAK